MITLEFTRVVLAIGVFAIGVELPKAYMARHWKSLVFLLVPVMTWVRPLCPGFLLLMANPRDTHQGWFVSAGLICALIPGLNFLSSLAVAACLTPTDPILAAAVVGGKWADKHVPAHIRHLLAAESGCNDGAAFPFLFIALYLTLDATTGAAVRDWFLILWLCEFPFYSTPKTYTRTHPIRPDRPRRRRWLPPRLQLPPPNDILPTPRPNRPPLLRSPIRLPRHAHHRRNDPPRLRRPPCRLLLRHRLRLGRFLQSADGRISVFKCD